MVFYYGDVTEANGHSSGGWLSTECVCIVLCIHLLVGMHLLITFGLLRAVIF